MADDAEDDLLEQLAETEGEGPGPSDVADPQRLVDEQVPPSIRKRYEVHSYRSAATILAQSHPEEFAEICAALDAFEITTDQIRTAGGNESDIPKLFSAALRPLDWRETVIRGDLKVKLISKQLVYVGKSGRTLTKPRSVLQEKPLYRERYLDGHKVDYVKGKVAFDLEWNSKDQTFDRDLYAFSAFAQTGVIDVGVLVTRGNAMTDFIKGLGPALKKDGTIERKQNGEERRTADKYGASTTWMGKLLYRLNAGRNGACPVLAIGITPECVVDR